VTELTDPTMAKSILAVVAAGGVGLAAGAIKVMADKNERSLKQAVAAVLAGGVFGGGCGAGLNAFTDLDPILISFVAGMCGAAGDHIIVAISAFAEPWRTKPKQAIQDIADLASGACAKDGEL
jgi:hypothetical protein